MSDSLDEFAEWARMHGHYAVAPLVDNFRKYQSQKQEQSRDAIAEKVKGDND